MQQGRGRMTAAHRMSKKKPALRASQVRPAACPARTPRPAVTCHTSHVTRHTSHVTRHTSHVTRHTSHVTRHTSHVTLHTSHVPRQASRVTCRSPAARCARAGTRQALHPSSNRSRNPQARTCKRRETRGHTNTDVGAAGGKEMGAGVYLIPAAQTSLAYMHRLLQFVIEGK